LSKPGRRQADAIAGTLVDAGVVRLLSSPYVRCAQTLQPASQKLGLEIELTDALAEGAGLHDALRLVSGNLDDNVALCSHGDVLGDLLHHYASQGIELHGDRVEKASIWVLQVEDADVRTATYLPPPEA
jgi:8-oxo-dGTP diphosphatase